MRVFIASASTTLNPCRLALNTVMLTADPVRDRVFSLAGKTGRYLSFPLAQLTSLLGVPLPSQT